MKFCFIVSLIGILPLLGVTAPANASNCKPTVLLVTNNSDGFPGSLRNQIALAASGDVIEFSGPMTINLGSPIVVLTNNITIKACYPDITLNALGNFPGLEFQGVTGCEVRGLRISGFNPALFFTNGANGNLMGGINPCDRIEIDMGLSGIRLIDPGTEDNEFYNIVLRNHLFDGLVLEDGACRNIFGDGSLQGAVFSFSNTRNGVLLRSSGIDVVEENEFSHCLIGTDLTGLVAAGNLENGVALIGVDVTRNAFLNCVLSGNAKAGILIAQFANDNRVEKSHIGVDINGTGAIGNLVGVNIEAGNDNHIYPMNVISGNQNDGVIIRSSSSYHNIIAHSALGPDILGNALGNGFAGAAVLDGAWENEFKENHISSNGQDGLHLGGNDPIHNKFLRNKIGTDATGSLAMPNAQHGVHIDSVATENYFYENLVSSNVQYGFALLGLGSDRNEFRGNRVGTDLAGVLALANGAGGMVVVSSSNIIGGLSLNDGNVICANNGWGVEIRGAAPGAFARNNRIEGNTIGMPGLGNISGGVFLDAGAVDNAVGGFAALGAMPGNHIHANGGVGVMVYNVSWPDPADGNQILSNSITANSARGIDIVGGGNCAIPVPLIAGATSGGVSGYTTVGAPALVQVFRDPADEGLEFLGEVFVGAGFSPWNLPVSLSPGDRITATQTADVGCTTAQSETSEFSAVMTAVAAGVLGCFCPNAVAPCGNPDPNAGCANSTGVGGTLSAHGSTSVAADDLTFSAERLPLNAFALLLGSRAQRLVPFRDGLLCVGGSGVRMWRFQLRNSRQWGAVVYGDGLVARSHMFSTPGHINPGDIWYFQTYYRDTFGPCLGGANLTNNVEISFTP